MYAFYERLPFARTPENRYAAFSYMIPVASRNPDSWHHVKIAYDRSAGIVRWELDGREVFRITCFFPPIGEPVPMTFMDEQSQSSNRIFGQGAEIKLLRYVVSSTPTSYLK